MEAIRSASWRHPVALPDRCLPQVLPIRIAYPPSPAASLAAAARPENTTNHMFVFGTGFVGRYVSERLMTEGWQVSGTCTNAAKKKQIEQMGMDAFIFEANKSKLTDLHSLQHATHLLISVPPIPGTGDPLLFLHEDLQRTLNHENVQWLCYLSSTSVYGDCGGAWVNEDHPVNPSSESARSRFAAEKGWLQLGGNLGLRVYIFRLGGIYGPGRSALDTIIKGKSLSVGQKSRESKQYTARVHVADIYQAIKASLICPSPRKLFNIVDDDPASRAEVFAFARSLIERRCPDMIRDLRGLPPAEAELPEGNVGSEKRISNACMKNDLGVRLLFPTYRSGLQNIIDSWLSDSTRPMRGR